MTTVVDEKTKEKLGPALGKVASGVYILTIKDDSGKEGMLTTWISQASFSPPMLSIAVNKERAIYSKLQKGSHLGVNVLSKENMDIFKSFAKPHEEGMDRFQDLELIESVDPPAFAKAVSFLKCTVKEVVPGGDHDVVLAEIIDGQVMNESAEPMTHIRKNGFQY